MRTSELSGSQLDNLVMRTEGFELIRVGYIGCDDETPEQINLPEWFADATGDSVGAYWMHRERKIIMDAQVEGYTNEWQKPALPSTDWAIAGPIIERERINVFFEFDKNLPQIWHAIPSTRPLIDARTGDGETPLVAAMRCFVASRFGENVPDEVNP